MSKRASLPAWAVDTVMLAVLALAALKANWRLEQLVDINGWDEAEYLHAAFAIPRAGFPDPAKEVFFAPLYSLWYWLLSHWQGDPVKLVDLNFRIMAVLLPCAMFGILRRAGCQVLVAAGAAFLLIANHLSLDPDTRTIHFAILMLAFGAWASLCVEGYVKQTAMLVLGAVAAAYARPEYGLLAICLGLLLALFCASKRFHLSRGEWLAIGAAALVATGCVLVFGSPLFAGNNRSFEAFSLGFSTNYASVHPSELNSWRDHVIITGKQFGESKSVAQALASNPKMFGWHFWHNLSGWVKGLFPALLSHRNFLLPDGGRMQVLECAIMALALGAILVIQPTHVVARIFSSIEQSALLMLFAVAVCGISLLGVLLTLVQVRYFFPIVFFGLVIIAIWLGRNPGFQGEACLPTSTLVIAAVILLALTPASSLHENRDTSLRTALAALGGVQFEPGTGYMESLADERMQIYLPSSLQFVSYRARHDGEAFRDFLTRRNIGIIHLTDFLRQDRFFLDDLGWNEFVANPGQFGFEVRSLPWNAALLIRRTALADR